MQFDGAIGLTHRGMHSGNAAHDKSLSIRLVLLLPELQGASVTFDSRLGVARAGLRCGQVLEGLALPCWSLRRPEKGCRKDELLARLLIGTQGKVDAAHVVQSHGLAKRLLDGSIQTQSQSKLLQGLGILLGVKMDAAQVDQDSSFLFSIVESRKVLQGLAKVLDGLR